MEHLGDLIIPPMTQFSTNVCVKFHDSKNEQNNLSMTFKEVDQLSNKIVEFLKGIGLKETSICLNFDQNSSEMIFYVPCIIGLIKMNCSFYFIENHQKITTEMETIKSEYILTDRKLQTTQDTKYLKSFPYKNQAIHLFVYTLKIRNDNDKRDKIAYIINTSGSTGHPKYVEVTHSSIVPNIIDIKDEFDVGPQDEILMASSPTFDPSIIDLFVSLSSGSSMLIVPQKGKMKKDLFEDIFIKNNVTILQCTPSLLDGFGRQFFSRTKPCLRILGLGGEKMSQETIKIATKLFDEGVSVYHLYGITEMSVWQSMFRIESVKQLHDLPIYQKENNILSKTKIFLQNGEIMVKSSDRVCFINFDHKVTDSSCIGTGDRGVWKQDDLYFIGRTNNVIKVNGQKVCLDKIERKLSKCFEASVYCVFDEDNKSVIAAVLKDETIHAETQHYFNLAIECLDTHEVPSKFIDITQVPTTLHGKIDKEELLKWAQVKNCKRPQKRSEDLLKTLWEQFLTKLPRNEDNFISSGGDSFQAVALANQLQDGISGDLPSDFLETLINCQYGQTVQLIRSQSISHGNKLDNNIVSVNKLAVDKRRKDSEETIVAKRIKSDPNNIRRSKGRQLGRQNIGVNLYTKVNISLDHLWNVDFSKCIDSSPLYIKTPLKHLIIVGSHSGKVGAVDIDTGEAVWMITLPDRVESSPVCDDQGLKLFLGCYDCRLYCLSLDTGEILWHFESQGYVKGSALVLSDCIFFGSYDHHLYKLSLSGGLIWKVKPGRGSLLATPMQVPLGVLVATLDGVIATVDLNGLTIWSVSIGFPVFSSPLLLKTENRILVGSVDNAGRCLSAQNGSILWKIQTQGPVFSSPISYKDDSILFGCHDNCVYCVNDEGNIIWKRDVVEKVFSSLDYNDQGIIIVAVTDGTVLLLSQEGEIVSQIKLPGEVFSSPILLENRAIVGCRDNYLYCLPVSYNL